MKRTFEKGDLIILVDVYSLCLEYDMERYIETSEWHEKMALVVEKKTDKGKVPQGYKILKSDGTIEYANALFLFDPEEYFTSTYEELYSVAMNERMMNEKIRWRKYSKIENDRDNGQTLLS